MLSNNKQFLKKTIPSLGIESFQKGGQAPMGKYIEDGSINLFIPAGN